MSAFDDKLTISSGSAKDELGLSGASGDDNLFGFLGLHESLWPDADSNGIADGYSIIGTPSIAVDQDGLVGRSQKIIVDGTTFRTRLTIPIALKTRELISAKIVLFCSVVSTADITLRRSDNSVVGTATVQDPGYNDNIYVIDAEFDPEETDSLVLAFDGTGAAQYVNIKSIDVEVVKNSASISGSEVAKDELSVSAGTAKDELSASSESSKDELASSAGVAIDNIAASNQSSEDLMTASAGSAIDNASLTSEVSVDNYLSEDSTNIYDFKFTELSLDFLTEAKDYDFLRN